MDVTVTVRNVFMVILEKKKIFELVTVPVDVISDMVAGEMCRSIIVVQGSIDLKCYRRGSYHQVPCS
jgi:hypothetical protein